MGLRMEPHYSYGGKTLGKIAVFSVRRSEPGLQKARWHRRMAVRVDRTCARRSSRGTQKHDIPSHGLWDRGSAGWLKQGI